MSFTDLNARSLAMHEKHQGKIAVVSKVPVQTRDDLSVAYSPGVAAPCKAIEANPEDVYRYTAKGNLVAVVSDGTAVLGLGDIGPLAALPVMEGKGILFKEFAGVDAFPLCLATKDVDEIVRTVKLLAPTFGGINLEDISAPRCVLIERRLQEELDIPVFHDDQHGTAIVVAAALTNALKVVGKKLEEVKIVINGAGAAGSAIAKMLYSMGGRNLDICDINGLLSRNVESDNALHIELANISNVDCRTGKLADAMKGADVFIGVSAGNIVSQDMVRSMAKDAIVLAMANPTPEIMPDLALAAGAKVVGTGRSDFPNQVNNVLAFPGIFRGALDVRARCINEEMKIAAAQAIAKIVTPDKLAADNIIPDPFDKSVVPSVAAAVAAAARRTGVARI